MPNRRVRWKTQWHRISTDTSFFKPDWRQSDDSRLIMAHIDIVKNKSNMNITGCSVMAFSSLGCVWGGSLFALKQAIQVFLNHGFIFFLPGVCIGIWFLLLGFLAFLFFQTIILKDLKCFQVQSSNSFYTTIKIILKNIFLGFLFGRGGGVFLFVSVLGFFWSWCSYWKSAISILLF